MARFEGMVVVYLMIEFYIDIRVVLVLVFAHGPSPLGPNVLRDITIHNSHEEYSLSIYHHGINYQYLKFRLTLG